MIATLKVQQEDTDSENEYSLVLKDSWKLLRSLVRWKGKAFKEKSTVGIKSQRHEQNILRVY